MEDRKQSHRDRRFGDQLLERIIAGTADNDSITNELLNECYRGYPIENLRRLLRSSDEATVKAGIWIATELGDAALPLLDDIAPLLEHHSRYVRFFALDAILLMASPTHAGLVAAAIHLINDPDEAVRWKCMQFLARATTTQLRASLRHFADLPLAARVAWLLKVVATTDVRDVMAVMDGENQVARLFAAAAAVRLAHSSLAPLEHAAADSDPEVSSFALEALKHSR